MLQVLKLIAHKSLRMTGCVISPAKCTHCVSYST